MKKKIYLFNDTDPPSKDNYCVAMAETGEALAGHISSSIRYMYGDLYGNRPERKKAWIKKFPEGIEIIELKQGELPPAEVLERNINLCKLRTYYNDMKKEESQLKTEIKITLQAQLKEDIKYFQVLRREEPEIREYCRGRIDEARYILVRLKEL